MEGMATKTKDGNSDEAKRPIMKSGIFTISLDFELHWGGFEKWILNEPKKAYFEKTRVLIPDLLTLFKQYDVHATWATVGMLMHSNKTDLLKALPIEKPTYKDSSLSAYSFLESEGIGEGEENDPYHYANSLVEQIIDTPNQELASHSFAHYYCNEEGQLLEQFSADCKAISTAATKYKAKLVSLVFPRNQFNEQYLKVCRAYGIKIVRSNPVDWWWQIDSTQSESKWKRLNRGADAYFNVGGKTSYPLESIVKQEGVYLLPASRLLRPYNPKELFLNTLKINKIKKELTLAAQNNEFYHLWWHPHNFGLFPKENMRGLKEILNHYQFLKSKYNMRSLTMGEIANHLESINFGE